MRFVWKASSRPALGLIAEEVMAVLPAVVERDAVLPLAAEPGRASMTWAEP